MLTVSSFDICFLNTTPRVLCQVLDGKSISEMICLVNQSSCSESFSSASVRYMLAGMHILTNNNQLGLPTLTAAADVTCWKASCERLLLLRVNPCKLGCCTWSGDNQVDPRLATFTEFCS